MKENKGEQAPYSVLLHGPEPACQMYSHPHTVPSTSSSSGVGPLLPRTPEKPSLSEMMGLKLPLYEQPTRALFALPRGLSCFVLDEVHEILRMTGNGMAVGFVALTAGPHGFPL